MIRYALKCTDHHSFESWFQSAEAFEKLHRTGMVACPVCGSEQVEKAIMAPPVRPSRSKAVVPAKPKAKEKPALNAPSAEVELALTKMREEVEKNADYVGLSFAAEARKMHDGDVPHRSIYGEAKPDEARKLIEDGVPVAPLPFIPNRKTN